MMSEAEHSAILACCKTRLRIPSPPGKIGTLIWKRRISGKHLPPGKTLSVLSGRKLTVAWAINLCGCAYGKRQTTGLRCEECSGGGDPALAGGRLLGV